MIKRGLILISILSTGLFTVLIFGLLLASRLLFSFFPGVYGFCIVLGLVIGFSLFATSVLFAAAYSILLHQDPGYFDEKGLVICG